MNAQKTSLLKQKSASERHEPTTWRRISATPKLRLHKATGQAYVVLNGKYIFFGPYGTPEIAEQYHRTIAEWHAAGKNPPSEAEETSINELAARYWKHVDAIEPHVSQQVWAMIQLQLLTAVRPGELVSMRLCDIDRSGEIWVYCPKEHKTAHHGHQRKIYIGPKGQDILQPFLFRPAEAYCFSPAETDAEKRVRSHANRKTPLSCGNLPGSVYQKNPQWQPSEQYSVDTYRRAIARGVGFAFPPPEHLRQRQDENKEQWQQRLTKKQREELKAWHKQYAWHPHQLRHNAATFLRKEFGLETARIILGHRSAVITEVYAEQDQQKALEAIVRVG